MLLFQTLSTADFIISFIVLFGLMGAFVYFNRPATSNNDAINYLIMGRTLSLPMFVATLVSSWYGGIFAVTEISFKHGVYNFLTQGIFWYISSLCFALLIVKRACKQQTFTLVGIIEKNYDQKTAYIFASLLFIKTLPITYAISIGFLIKSTFDLPLEIGITIGSLIIMLYCLNGGFKRILLIDIMQFFLMLFAVIAVIYFSWTTFGGINYLKTNLPTEHFKLQGNHNFSTVVLWFIIAISTTFLSPIFYHRCFAAKDYMLARKGIIVSMLFWFVCDIGTTMGGMYAKAHLPEIDSGIAYFIYALEILPSGFKGIFLIAIFVTLFSALATHLFASSTILSYDLAPLKSRTSRVYQNGSIVATTVVTIVVAFLFNGDLEKAWIFSESIFLASAFIPVLLAFFAKEKPSSQSVINALIITAIGTTAWELSPYNIYLESFFFGITLNFCYFVAIYFNSIIKIKRI